MPEFPQPIDRSVLREIQKRETEKLDKILFYDERACCGIAYRKDTGKLVEYLVEDRCLHPEEIKLGTDEIALVDSADWVERMYFAETRFDLCIQFGPAFTRWLADIGTALSAKATAQAAPVAPQ